METSGRVLLVDDTHATAYSTARVLRGAGYEVVIATTGTQALELADNSLDVVVLDVRLPDMHGFDVLRKIRAKAETALLPVVHLSATYRTPTHQAEGLDSGADGYLIHPVDPMVLVATIKTLLRVRRAEEERRSTEAQFRLLFEDAPIGICFVDGRGVFSEVNPALCRLLGRDRRTLVGSKFGDFVDDRESLDLAAILDPADPKSEWKGTLTLMRSDESLVFVDWHFKSFTQSNLRVGLASDVTAQRIFEAEREALLASERASREEAERISRQKDQFIAVLGHELRNPLAVIAAGIDLLKMGTPGEDQSWVRTNIEKQTEHLASLINDLVDTTRISHGKLKLNKRPVSVNAAVRSAVESCADSLQRSRHRLSVSVYPPEMSIHADPLRLDQIITNLLTNAVKYTKQPGVISLTAAEENGKLELTVVDTGIGLSERDVNRIFEPFTQVGAPGQGLGIGLTLVKQLVELHGGSISVESPGLGKGSTFRVVLPGVRDPVVDTKQTTTNLVADEPLRILIVDDNEPVALMLQTLLRGLGHRPEVAFNGMSAIPLALKLDPDLVLLDIGLPDISGYEVAERLRSHGLQKATLVAISGFTHEEAKASLRRSKFDSHLVKPASATQLRNLVHAVSEKKRADPTSHTS